MPKNILIKNTLLALGISSIAMTAFATIAISPQPCIGLKLWNPDTTYSSTTGVKVQNKGSAYKSNYWNKNDAPISNHAVGDPWTLLGTCEIPATDKVSPKINNFPTGGLVFTDPTGKKYTLTTPETNIQLPYDPGSAVTYQIAASNFSGSVTPSSFVADGPSQVLQLTYNKFTQPKHQLVGYLDASDPGTAEAALGMTGPTSYPANLVNLKKAGYKTIVWGWLTVGTGSGTTFNPTGVEFFNTQNGQIIDTVTPIARANNMTVLISTGGSAQLFEKALIGKNASGVGTSLTPTQVNTLANNIVLFLQKNNIQGIDFDIETHINGTFLNNLILALKKAWPQIIITAAPQLNSNGSVAQLVSTGNDTDYAKALANNGFTEIFVQDYCTGGYYLDNVGDLSPTPKQGYYSELSSQFITPSYNAVSNYIASIPNSTGNPITTKIFLGEPASNAAAGCAVNIYASSKASGYPKVWSDLSSQYQSLLNEPNYGGAMVWSVNGDFANTPKLGFATNVSKAFPTEM